MRIVEYDELKDSERFYKVLFELRPLLSLEEFRKIYIQANKSDQYTLVGVESQDEIVAVMGFRVLYDFVHGKHLYIDDLVVTNKMRGKNVGKNLISYAEKKAHELSCSKLRLCTGIENEGAKKFYERHEWKLRAVVYKKKI